MSVHRARVNGAFLPQYHNKPVCLLGTIMKADGGGNSFQMKASDGVQVNIRLKNITLTEPLTGLAEVYGIGQGRNLILADSYTSFPEQISATFDMPTYNEALTVIQQQTENNPWLPAN